MEDTGIILTAEMVTKYHTGASICGKIYNELKNLIINENKRCVKELSEIGNTRMLEELSKIYKKEKDKNIAFPVSISLNNCIENFVYDYNNPDSEYNTIKDTDVIKIEFGVSISGCISIIGETFTINENKQVDEINTFLTKIQKDIIKRIKHEETADEIRMYIESKSTDNDVFPIENCMSYQQEVGQLTGSESKYMILNYKKYYDKDDYLIGPENINYEFE